MWVKVLKYLTSLEEKKYYRAVYILIVTALVLLVMYLNDTAKRYQADCRQLIAERDSLIQSKVDEIIKCQVLCSQEKTEIYKAFAKEGKERESLTREMYDKIMDQQRKLINALR